MTQTDWKLLWDGPEGSPPCLEAKKVEKMTLKSEKTDEMAFFDMKKCKNESIVSLKTVQNLNFIDWNLF